jgi:hypothetical protein
MMHCTIPSTPYRRCTALTAGFLLFLFAITASAQDTIPYPSSLDSAAVIQTDISDIAAKGMIVGNGEMNGILYSSGNDLYIRVSKNDVWDGRVNTSGDPALPVINPATHSFTGSIGAQASWNNYTYPTPVPPADIKLAAMAGQSGWNTTLDLRRASATVVTSADRTTVRVLAQSNVFYITSPRTITLQGISQSFLPAATTGTSGSVQWLRQNLPADADTKGMDVYLALGKSGSRQVVAVVTSLDTADPQTAAVNHVNTTLASDTTALFQAHESVWRDFWTQSGISTGEPAFQRRWYHEVYFFRCYAKKGATGVGLRAAMYTIPGWHGTFKFNYNEQQGYAAAGPINHPELVEPLIDVVNNYWPRARWLAATCFVGCEGGFVHSDVYNPHEPDPAVCTTKNRHQSAYLPWGFSLGMLGHIATNMWEYFQYKPDTVYLTNKIYPVLRDMALFYCSFLEKCSRDGSNKFIIGPSFFPENGNFGQDNTPYDIAYITYCFNAAKEAATILKTDAALITRITNAVNAMPTYSTVADPNQGNQTIVEEWKGSGVQGADRHGSSIQPVYPAGLINWFSPASDKNLFIRTINKVVTIDETNAYITENIARARLGLITDCYNDALTSPRSGYQYYTEKPNGLFWMNEGHEYYISEQTAYARLVSEMLMQSVGNIIRVFPAWPAATAAKFARLRAQGGFLVSAELTGGVIGDITVRSTAGGTIKLVSPWPAIQVKFQDGSTQRLTLDTQGVVQVATTGGLTYVFQRPSTGTIFVGTQPGAAQGISLIVKYNGMAVKKALFIPADIANSTARLYIGLFDVKGRLVAGRNIGPGEGRRSSVIFDLGRLMVSPGIYCISVRNGRRSFSARLNLP